LFVVVSFSGIACWKDWMILGSRYGMRTLIREYEVSTIPIIYDYVDLAVEGVAPVVVKLGDVDIEKQVTIFPNVSRWRRTDRHLASVRQRAHERDQFPATTRRIDPRFGSRLNFGSDPSAA
jgi:hypothetical protein